MGEESTRTGYVWDRVLIEAGRILNPCFNAQAVFLSGAQVELLRNVTEYLRRQSTYVEDYHGTYYNTVKGEAWDTILSVVADLEDKLMANENTPWGYNDRWAQQVSDLTADAGTNVLSFPAVPEGYVYTLNLLGAVDNTSGASIEMRVTGDAVPVTVLPVVAAGAGSWKWSGPLELRLKEDDVVSITFYGCTAGDDLYARLWGWMMVVPE